MTRTTPVLPLALIGLLLAGCGSGPTYPKAQLAEQLTEILLDQQLNASVKFVDHTLGVHLAYPGSLAQTDAQIEIGPEFSEAIRKSLTAIHRVMLSTDAELNFYVLLLSAPEVPGAYLTLVRYVDDVRRANANMIDSEEMFARTIYELDFVGAAPVTIDQYVPRDIEFEEFLSWQLAKRIESTLVKEFQVPGVADIGRCGGSFQNGEFVMTLEVAPMTETQLDDATLQQVFRTSTGVMATVLSNYEFDSFDQIRLIHSFSGRNLILPKTHLEIFR